MQSHHNMFMQETNHNHNNVINNNNINHNNNNIKNKTTIPRHHGPTTTQACAACKYQRRKCASDCILAPYFPHDRQHQFLNAHRLFGVSNIVKIVRNLDPQSKDQAMRTIIFQSDARAADPVGGCYRIIKDLEHRITLAKAELDIVLHHLAICRAVAAAAHNHHKVVVPTSEMEAGVVVDDVNGSWGNCMMHAQLQHAESTSSLFPPHENNEGGGGGGGEHHRLHHHHVRRPSMEECDDSDDFRPILDQLGCDDDDGDDLRQDEMIRFDCNGNVVTSNNNAISSEDSKVTFKEDEDCFAYVEEDNDLKAAATFFSLTNCDI